MAAPYEVPPTAGNPLTSGAQPPPYTAQQFPGYPPTGPVMGQLQPLTQYGAHPGASLSQPVYPVPNQQPYGSVPPTGYAPQLQPIVMQPASSGGEWMPMQQQFQRSPNCPPGLEYLTAIDQLLVHQKVELLEAFVGFETANKYTVKNSFGQKVFYAGEKSDCCSRQFCGPNRPFEMKIMDNHGQEVIHLNRPLACTNCCFPCCLQNMEVTSPPGTLIGSIQQEWSIFKPKFSVKDVTGQTVLLIEGPFCTFSLCGDVEFNVYSSDGSTKVGKISKQWSGLVREAFTDADMFGINFPLDLDIRMKAVLLGACFLIDFMFFEKSGNKENDGPGMF